MSAWFFNDGTPAENVTPATADKGSAPRWHNCSRCGGAGGSSKWIRTGYTCFKCGGACGHVQTDTVYSAAKFAKLVATREKAAATRARKREAKRVAERDAARIARRDVFQAQESAWRRAWALRRSDRFLADLIKQGLSRRPLTAGQVAALAPAVEKAEAWQAERRRKAEARAAQRHVGKVGERIEIDVTCEKRIVGGDRYSRWGCWVLTILKTADGNVLATFGRCEFKEGDAGRIRCTVKEHTTNRTTGAPETRIERLKHLEPATA